VKQEGATSPRACARGQLLGAVCNQLERYAQAVKVLRPVYDALPAEDRERRAGVAFELGLALDRTGAREEGLRRIEEALRLTRQLSEGGRPHPALPNRLTMMAQVHLDRGRVEEAEGVLLEALEVEKRLQGEASPEVAARYAALGAFCVRHGREQEALGWADAAASLLRSTLGDEHPDTKAAVEQAAALLLREAEAALARRDRELAADLLKRGTEIAAPVLGFTHEKVRKIRDLGAKHRLA
jgi:tetratricopeptide (TPR) repeat protein